LYNNDSAAEYVLTWNTLGIGLEDGATIDSTKIILEADPMFVDPDNGNFDLMEGSPAIGYAESGNNLGDPRWKVTTATNIVEEGIEIPSDFNLFQNYPNPFNPTTSINYSLKAESHVTLEIFNILGNKVRSLVNERQSAGNYTISWDGRNDKYQKLSSGVYLYKINCDNFISIKKMIKLK
ncbi:MAG: T9SS type A sorting domain-containing protein, partial [Ignavibacteriae bacterium]|nr:T9SS type A sorting domain-containing protein [Ignavibacteriota bacterium]